MKHFISCASLAGLLFSGLAISGTEALAQTSPTKTVDETKRAEVLFHQMKSEAGQIQSTAQQLETLTRNANPQWLQYDLQWNEIKPAQEALIRSMWSLDSMRAELSPAEQQAVDQAKQAVDRITTETRHLRTLLDQPGVNLKSPQFEASGRELVKHAEALASAASSKIS
ncbi:MAG TPA: hypothetical protein VGN17_02445 [Bryobacteraceae bacterium]|jgi:hypothetical protein